MSNIAYKLVVETNEREVHSVVLDSGMLTELVTLPNPRVEDEGDCEDEFVRLLGYLAQSSSPVVRRIAASNDAIDEDTVELLAKDEDIQVRRHLASLDKFKTWAHEEIVIDYIQSDAQCAAEIARWLGDFRLVDIDKIADVLRNHSDPLVRRALADSWHTSYEILEQQLTDPDHSVRCLARDTLNRG